MNTIPILLDTDIGSDIDDAIALAYLLKQPRCDLVGITTVSGEPDKRASLADAVCRAAGHDDVPIHVGAARPLLLETVHQPRAPQAEALSADWPHRQFGLENTAIDFLRTTIRARPGELTLMPIGPLTNVALLFALDPEILSLIKQVVLMGGQFSRPGAEWNILNDPHAAAMVFRAPIPRLIAVGLDVTTRCQLPADECRQRFADAGGPLALVAAMAEVWFRHASRITFHDPLAAALVFEQSLCRLESSQIEVELVSPRAPGQTWVVPDTPDKPHLIAAEVNPDAFFAHYFATVGGS